MTEPLLQVNNLQTYFKTQDGLVKAVDGVSYYVRKGETLGIVGESGCGKSVSALSVMRLIPQPPGEIAGGEVIFDGENLLELSEEEMRHIRGNRISMVFQDPMTSLNPVLTINRQVNEALELHLGMDRVSARERTLELLRMVGIPSAEKRLDDYPHQFSGGMRQRVMIAMSLSCNPEVLIADEPTTALDVTIQAQILDLINKLKQELGTAVIIITHDLGVIAGMSDRVVVMYAGHIVESADTYELFGNPRMPYTLGLMRSLPRVDATEKRKLDPIRGLPPDLIDLPDMCPFVPRCDYAQPRCEQSAPPLRKVGEGHWAACWFDINKDGWMTKPGVPAVEA